MIMSTKPFDKEAAHGWKVVMQSINELRSNGATLQDIGKKLGVSKGTVSRWISENRGGEKNSFGDMVRYATKLGISPQEMFGMQAVEPDAFDMAVGAELAENMQMSGLTNQQIAAQSLLSELCVAEIIEERRVASFRELHFICKAIGLNPTILFNKAAKKTDAPETEVRQSA